MTAGQGAPAATCVLIPAWQDQEGLSRTLDALKDDPFPFDVVVVDDGSTVPMRCPATCGGHALTLIRLPQNQGIEHALNAGLAHVLAHGYRYVARLDCGDLPLPGRISRQVQFLDDAPDVSVVGTWARCVDDGGAYLFTLRFPQDDAAIRRKHRYVPGLLHPTVLIRVAVLLEVGLYSDRYRTAEDYDLFVRLGRGHRLANIPEALTEYVVSAGGTTSTRRRRTLVSRLGVQRANFDWRDPHASLGILRTIALMGVPFGWLTAAKSVLWR